MAYITRVTVGKASDPGKTRDHNEDFYLASESGVDDRDKVARQGRLFIVADGMGGHASGEEASKAAVEAIHRAYEDSFATNPTPDVREALTTALLQANAEIFRKARVEGKQGMGTTAVCAVVLGDELFVAHVGDSRAYLVHDEKISQLTTDHSWVAQQQAEKQMTREEARISTERNVILRALGPRAEVVPEVSGPLALAAGDVVLLCTDGVWGEVEDDQIEYLLRANTRDPQKAVDYLIEAANRAGGNDNATAVVVRVDKVSGSANEVVGKRAVWRTPTVIAGLGVAILLGVFLGVIGTLGVLPRLNALQASILGTVPLESSQATLTPMVVAVRETVLVTVLAPRPTNLPVTATIIPALASELTGTATMPPTPSSTPTSAPSATEVAVTTATPQATTVSKYSQIPTGIIPLPGRITATYFLDDGNGAVQFTPDVSSTEAPKIWNSVAQPGLNGGMRWVTTDITASATWQMDVPLPAGTYELFVFIPSLNSQAQVPYYVFLDGVKQLPTILDTHIVDQRNLSNKWVSIGRYVIQASGVLSVSVTTNDATKPSKYTALGVDALAIVATK